MCGPVVSQEPVDTQETEALERKYPGIFLASDAGQASIGRYFKGLKGPINSVSSTWFAKIWEVLDPLQLKWEFLVEEQRKDPTMAPLI